ncbi:MAG TPA: peptidylprolyl isomerase [Candidatus Krumholzibacteria bacterium]
MDPPLLRLGAHALLRSDFERHVRRLEARDGPIPDDVQETLLQSYLEERVLVLEARQQGLLTPQASSEDELGAIEELLAGEVLPEVTIEEASIRRYYDAHQAELQIPETLSLSQILVPTLNEARDVRRRLYKDRRSFEQLAQTRSKSPEASNGGLMGTFGRGQLPPDLEEAAFSLQPGRISSIIETPLGFHVLRVDAHQEAQTRSLEECRDEIHAELMRQAYAAAVKRYIAGLLARAEVNS